MRIRPEETWLIVAIISAVAAIISAAMAVLSAAGGSTVHATISVVSLILFSVCTAEAWTIRYRISKMEDIDEEILCLRLKRAGVERYGEEIVPKGKMPQE